MSIRDEFLASKVGTAKTIVTLAWWHGISIRFVMKQIWPREKW